MNNKAFTLPELLATLVILGVISTIGIVSVSSYTRRAKERAYCQIKESIIVATESYMIKNGVKTEIKINDLVNDGFLNSPIDPVSKTACNYSDNSSVVSISETDVNASKYNYTITLNCGNNGNKSLESILSEFSC